MRFYQIGFARAEVFWEDRRNTNRATTRVSQMLWQFIYKYFNACSK